MMPFRCVCLIFALALGGCTEPPAPRTEPDASDRAMERSIQEPLERARAVEEEMRKARLEQDARLREQEG
jgi:hypothetical protein